MQVCLRPVQTIRSLFDVELFAEFAQSSSSLMREDSNMICSSVRFGAQFWIDRLCKISSKFGEILKIKRIKWEVLDEHSRFCCLVFEQLKFQLLIFWVKGFHETGAE